MKFIYCSDPIDQRLPDSDFEAEAAEAVAVGAEYILVSYEALVNGADAMRSVRRVPEHDIQSLAIYRGWMLKPDQYEQLYEALLTRASWSPVDPTTPASTSFHDFLHPK